MRMAIGKATFGIKMVDGRSFGLIPVKLLRKAGIRPDQRVEINFIPGEKGQRGRLVFSAIYDGYRSRGEVIVRLKHAGRSRHARFEQQGILFDGGPSQECDCEVNDDKVHLLLPKGTKPRSLNVDDSPDAPDMEVEERKLLEATADRAEPVKWNGLSPLANECAQAIVEAIQRLSLQQRIFDVMRGRGIEEPQALWDALYKEIY